MAASASDNDDVAEIMTSNSAASSSHRSKQEKGEEKDEFMTIVKRKSTISSRMFVSFKLHLTSYNK